VIHIIQFTFSGRSDENEQRKWCRNSAHNDRRQSSHISYFSVLTAQTVLRVPQHGWYVVSSR